MTTPLDRDLAERLERLAAAVPVRAGQLDPVHASAVAARQQVRMRWLTPLVVLLVAALAYVLLAGSGHDRPLGTTESEGPAPSSEVDGADGPAVDMARDGDFALTLRAGKRHYAPNELIQVAGTLTYLGPKAIIEIDTDSGGPIQFGLQEKVFGAVSVGSSSLLMCKRTTLTRNAPLVEPFKKGGSFDGEHPDAEKLKAFLLDKQLRLPEGTWHIYAIARAPCMGGDATFDLRTEIEIVVDDDPNATPGQPVATEWQDKPVYGGDDIGDMIFQVKSTHPVYEEGTPIDVDAWFWFAEGQPIYAEPFVQEHELLITQDDPSAATVRTGAAPTTCETTTMAPREERHLELDAAHTSLIKAASWPAASEEALARGEILLPIGRWRITVVARAMFGPCGNPDPTWQVHASVEVDVVPRT